MITRHQLIDGLRSGAYRIELAEWGDGQRGVGLQRANGNTIERIALAPWHVDQDDGLQFADKARYQGWYYNIFQAVELSKQARQLLVAHCKAHEAEILEWCEGDEEATLSPLNLGEVSA
jgi:hypothetical protein